MAFGPFQGDGGRSGQGKMRWEGEYRVVDMEQGKGFRKRQGT